MRQRLRRAAGSGPPCGQRPQPRTRPVAGRARRVGSRRPRRARGRLEGTRGFKADHGRLSVKSGDSPEGPRRSPRTQSPPAAPRSSDELALRPTWEDRKQGRAEPAAVLQRPSCPLTSRGVLTSQTAPAALGPGQRARRPAARGRCGAAQGCSAPGPRTPPQWPPRGLLRVTVLDATERRENARPLRPHGAPPPPRPSSGPNHHPLLRGPSFTAGPAGPGQSPLRRGKATRLPRSLCPVRARRHLAVAEECSQRTSLPAWRARWVGSGMTWWFYTKLCGCASLIPKCLRPGGQFLSITILHCISTASWLRC